MRPSVRNGIEPRNWLGPNVPWNRQAFVAMEPIAMPVTSAPITAAWLHTGPKVTASHRSEVVRFLRSKLPMESRLAVHQSSS